MLRNHKYLIVLIKLSMIILVGCMTSSVEPKLDKIEFLGFEDKFALRMVIAEPHLYVCAGSDGVWRRNIRVMSDWEYLGLRDTSLGKYTNVGVLDIDVLNQDILVAYKGLAPGLIPDSVVSVWRSTNSGAEWFRSDTGILQSRQDPEEPNVINSLQRSPHQKATVIAVYGPAHYKSTDYGANWNFSGIRGVFVNQDYVRWHPIKPGEVWFFGETSVFSPYCYAKSDYGITPKLSVNFDSLDFPSDAAVNDIAFDVNVDIIHIATSYGIISTSNGGYTWQQNVVSLPDSGFVFRMAHHPSIGGLIYMAGGKRIYRTQKKVAGYTVNLIGEIDRGFITSLVYDLKFNKLFIGTTEGGIYALKF